MCSSGPHLYVLCPGIQKSGLWEYLLATFFPWEEMCLLEICLLRRGKTVIWWGFSSHESCTNEWV